MLRRPTLVGYGRQYDQMDTDRQDMKAERKTLIVWHISCWLVLFQTTWLFDIDVNTDTASTLNTWSQAHARIMKQINCEMAQEIRVRNSTLPNSLPIR